jgi:hypothetical protein
MTEETEKKTIEEWQPYHLDHHAQELVLKYRDKKDCCLWVRAFLG